MATIQHSIGVNVPVHAAYNQLTQFEEYPRFMEDVEAVQQIDDTHLHLSARLADRPVEWDAEITEQEPDRCIVWHSTNGLPLSGKMEVQALSDDRSQVTFTLHGQPEQLAGSMAGATETEMAQRLRQDLTRLKSYIEAQGPHASGWRGEVHDANVTANDAGMAQQPAVPARGNAAAPADAHAMRDAHGKGTSAVVGASGGTDAAAGARLSGSKGGPGGPSLRETTDASGGPGTPGGMMQGDAVSPAAGANAAGGTGLGSAATADDTRTGTGTSSGSGTALTGGGMSGGRDAGIAPAKGNGP